MKHFFEVFFLAVAGIAFSLGNIPVGIFGGMFAVIGWMWPISKNVKTPDQIYAESTGQKNSNVQVVYEFIANEGETFTANLHSYDVEPETIKKVLSEYVAEHTGIPVSEERLHVLSIKQL